jgi:hypothetical protein
MPKHSNCFGSGYVYEHRLVVENYLGRTLKPNEIVHHKDGNKLNNSIDNLELCRTIAEHKYEHRLQNSRIKRKPNEPNILIKCDCGCGLEFLKYDKYGRERKYATSGCSKRHNRILRQEEQSKVLVLCACGCGNKIQKYDKYGRVKSYISGHNHTEVINRTKIASDCGLSFCTVSHYFNGHTVGNKSKNLIQNSIIKFYGKDYLSK